LKVFFAGNFPQMKDPEAEKAVRDVVVKRFPEYRRLGSYYFEEDIQTLIDMRREENDTTGSS